MTLHTYLPQDRLRALSRGKTFPDRTSGVALAEWALDPSAVETGLKKGEALDWDETVRELLQG